jgi:Zn-dependent protease with chaperone function
MRVLEEAVYIDNISSAILVGPTQMPSLHSSLVEAASILDLPVLPELYIKQSPVPNAYCMAIQGRRPFIVMHTSLLDLLSPAEVQVVLAHELSHIKCEHGVFITAANALALGLYSLGGSLGRVLGDRLSSLLYAWLRAAEFSCDRGALLVSQDLDTVLSALLKLVGGSQQLAGQLSTEAFLQQARSYDQAVGSPLGRLIKSQMEPGLTHPLPVLRVRELERWYKSDMYTGIIARGSRRAAETGQDGGIEGAGGDRRGQDGGERKGGSGAETV